MGQGVNIKTFNSLSDKQKKELLVDAQKVAEYREELLRLGDFYVEVKVDFLQRYRVITNTYSLNNIPFISAAQVAKV